MIDHSAEIETSVPARLPSADEAPDGVDAALWAAAAAVTDPEIPVISIADLGILRDARIADDGTAVVTITPTYSGCPAMDTITDDVAAAVRAAGHAQVRVDTVLQPAWTTDWMTERGREVLRDYGIAPPTGRAAAGPVAVGLSVKCPRCDSTNTRETTRFSSTACKALYQCRDCLEPFDHFKVH
ncbi:1,2-phenylacetyl-CoA epoxidase subunit PaaD [Nesterenkonia sp. F]|uniref:1,2-phenylacetyl-CoA epoxidase subunit PaaD n=1 Tax=Nesterenkonia sp. F TaxID=795955 RepID=UPI00030A17B8|nr:1,2-phenylacetyl-CoA epoxidase subunit PaaD [Nesterenkonia sp. F]